MAFSTQGAIGGAMTGAQYGSLLGPIGTGVGALAGGALGGLFGGTKKKTTSLQDLRTPEQKANIALLNQLAGTGYAAGINLGEAYGGSLGNYDLTSGEQNAYSQLAGLFGGQDLSKARETYTNLADTKFDPSDPRSGYAAYSRELAKAQKESGDVLNRESAISGSRFGTGILQNKRELADTFANQRATKLAELFQNSRSSQLAGAQGLQGLVGTQANLANQQAQMASLQRDLLNQEASAKYSEFQRQRGETLSRIDLMSQEANRNPLLGISSITSEVPTEFQSLLNSFTGGGGGGLSSLFGGGGSTGGFGGGLSSLLASLTGGSMGMSKQSQTLGFNTAQYR